MIIYHLALASDWKAARESGTYTTSTLGRTLEEEGFIHAARREQVEGVHDRYYRGVRKPLVILGIDTDRLTSPWREEAVGDDTFPHIHGPLNASAVVGVKGWHRSGRPVGFTEMFYSEVLKRILIAAAVMLAIVALVELIR